MMREWTLSADGRAGTGVPWFARDEKRMQSGDWRFFFSSRRRHTRSYGDWSSDVCSSDLGELGEPAALGRLRGGAVWFDHLREELLSGHRFENKGEEPFADIELAAAHRDAQIGRASCRERVQI